MSSSDRIEKDVVLPAPRSRVWAAIGDSAEFGAWFNCRFEGPFEAGKELRATLQEPGYEGFPFVVFVERVEPERHLSFRWHVNHDVDLDGDYADDPTTLVSFDLEDADGGTRLRIVESGFDAAGDAGAKARERNAQGWAIQAERVTTYVGDAT